MVVTESTYPTDFNQLFVPSEKKKLTSPPLPPIRNRNVILNKFGISQIGAVPLAALGAPTLDPALAALGLPGANLNSQV